jgi:hypothetical protein
MPYQRWVNTCSCSTYSRTGDPECPSCGQQREVAGWSYSMYESMAAYQSLYGLKPVGPHRKLTDESFRSMTVSCDACGGEGLLDNPPRWIACATCRGFGSVFTVPPEVVDGVRSQILEAFPDAAAERVDGVFQATWPRTKNDLYAAASSAPPPAGPPTGHRPHVLVG